MGPTSAMSHRWGWLCWLQLALLILKCQVRLDNGGWVVGDDHEFRQQEERWFVVVRRATKCWSLEVDALINNVTCIGVQLSHMWLIYYTPYSKLYTTPIQCHN